MDSDAEKRKQNKCMGAPRGCTFFCRVSLRIETDANVLQVNTGDVDLVQMRWTSLT